MTERAFLIHCARVYLAQAAHFRRRDNPHVANYFWVLLESAQKARRDAAALPVVVQSELFA